jgi:hypothetical protein
MFLAIFVSQVHTVDYVNYLRDAYQNWVQDGGDKVSTNPTVLIETIYTQQWHLPGGSSP